MGLARGANTNTNDVAAPVDVGRDRRIDFTANGGKALAKFRGSKSIDGQTLVVNASQLLELVGFQSL